MSEPILGAPLIPVPIVVGTVAAANEALANRPFATDVLLLSDNGIELTHACVAELVAVAGLSDRHGIIVPRIGIPDAEGVGALLPRCQPVPHWDGYAMLIRADLMDDYGLIDESYSDLATAGAEFSLRVNRYGYSTIRANQAAVVLPAGVADIRDGDVGTARRPRFDVEALEENYPYVSQLTEQYAVWSHPAVEFEQLITSNDHSVVIYLGDITRELSGTSRVVISFLHYVASRPDSGRFSVYAEPAATEFFSLATTGLELLDEVSVGVRQFALGYVPYRVADVGMLEFLALHCLRSVVTVLDVAEVRTNERVAERFHSKAVFHESLEFADGIIAVSQASQVDTDLLFGCKECSAKIAVIPQGFPDVRFASSTNQPGPYQQVIAALEPGFAFMSGNRYPHKRVALAIAALRNGGFQGPVVCLGAEDSFEVGSGLYVLRGGVVPEEVIEAIRRRADMFIFPSSYEGFGFSIADAAHYNKPIIATDMPTTRETAALYPRARIEFFSRLSELGGLATAVAEDAVTAVRASGVSDVASVEPDVVADGERSLADYGSDVIAYLDQVLSQRIDAGVLLHKRQRIAGVSYSGDHRLRRQLAEVEAERERQVAGLQTELEMERSKVAALLATSSWRVTAPLRALTDRARSIARRAGR
jgi:glycosyltransferase involved in cell wall biosynthesis